MSELIRLLREYNCTRGTQARAADQIEQLQADYKQLDYKFESFLLGREDIRTLQSTIEQLETDNKILKIDIEHAEINGRLDAVEEIEQLGARVEELEGLINKIYNGDCNLATASIIAANFIPPPEEKDNA